MHWAQTAAMSVNNNYTGFQQIKLGVRQSCVLSPVFFLYSEHIIHNIVDLSGTKLEDIGSIIYDLPVTRCRGYHNSKPHLELHLYLVIMLQHSDKTGQWDK